VRSSVSAVGIESPNTAGGAHRQWTKLAVATLALVVISAIGWIGSLVVTGDHSNGETVSTSEQLFGRWLMLSWLLCLFVGLFAWIRGGMTAQSRTALAGRLALAYVVLVVLVAVLIFSQTFD
jgi:hypothetical protein